MNNNHNNEIQMNYQLSYPSLQKKFVNPSQILDNNLSQVNDYDIINSISSSRSFDANILSSSIPIHNNDYQTGTNEEMNINSLSYDSMNKTLASLNNHDQIIIPSNTNNVSSNSQKEHTSTKSINNDKDTKNQNKNDITTNHSLSLSRSNSLENNNNKDKNLSENVQLNKNMSIHSSTRDELSTSSNDMNPIPLSIHNKSIQDDKLDSNHDPILLNQHRNISDSKQNTLQHKSTMDKLIQMNSNNNINSLNKESSESTYLHTISENIKLPSPVQSKVYKTTNIHKRIQRPKNIRSAYNYFAESVFSNYNKNSNISTQQLLIKASEQWKLLSDKDKVIFEQKHREDEERYRNDIQAMEDDLEEKGIHYIHSHRECIKAITKGIDKKDIRLFVSGLLSYNKYDIDRMLTLLTSSTELLKEIYRSTFMDFDNIDYSKELLSSSLPLSSTDSSLLVNSNTDNTLSVPKMSMTVPNYSLQNTSNNHNQSLSNNTNSNELSMSTVIPSINMNSSLDLMSHNTLYSHYLNLDLSHNTVSTTTALSSQPIQTNEADSEIAIHSLTIPMTNPVNTINSSMNTYSSLSNINSMNVSSLGMDIQENGTSSLSNSEIETRKNLVHESSMNTMNNENMNIHTVMHQNHNSETLSDKDMNDLSSNSETSNVDDSVIDSSSSNPNNRSCNQSNTILLSSSLPTINSNSPVIQVNSNYETYNSVMHPDDVSKNSLLLKKEDSLLRFPCLYKGCNKIFASKTSLKTHEKSHYPRNLLFICEIPSCGKAFTSYSSFNKHKLSHKQDVSYTCNYPNCGKIYKTKQGLKYHILQKHENLKQYICPIDSCGKSFVRKSELNLHLIRMHSSNRPFHCMFPNCASSFASQAELRRHNKFHKLL